MYQALCSGSCMYGAVWDLYGSHSGPDLRPVWEGTGMGIRATTGSEWVVHGR